MLTREKLIKFIFDCLEDNDEHDWDTGYQKNYAEGYHDAMLVILDHLEVKHDEEYYFQ